MLEQFTAHITPFGKDRVVRVWLPDGIETARTAYPVLYMFDGHNLFRDEWATYGKCWGLADFLARWEKPVIVVAPECDKEGNNRLIEYAPYDMEIPPCGFVHGRGAELMDWTLGELKPYVDRIYPTIPFREATGVGGSSMGGLMSLFTVLRYNRWFSKAACLSSSFRFCFGQLLEEGIPELGECRMRDQRGPGQCHRSQSDSQPGADAERGAHLSLSPCGRRPLRSRLGKRGAPLYGLSLARIKASLQDTSERL